MRTAAHFRPLCCCLLMFASLAFSPTACHAVSMDVTVGFDGVEKRGAWTPVAVKLANPSDENLDGVLIVESPDAPGGTPMPMCTTKVVLPAHSNKLYHAYIRLPEYAGKLSVTFARGYGVLATRDVNVNPASEEEKLLVTVGDRSARLSFMQGETVQVPVRPNPYNSPAPSAPGNQGVTIHAGSLYQDLLPDRPAAYEGVDVLVLSGLTPDSANPNALKAICMWVASGGTLVIPTGPDYRAFTNAFYDELLPVTIQGAASLPGMASLGALGNAPFPQGPAAVAKSKLKLGIGTVVISESGVPIIAQRNYGAGQVFFLAFDLRSSPFKDWNGQTEFWKRLIKGSATRKPMAPTDNSFADQYRSGYPYRYGGQQSRDGFAGLVMQHPSVKIPTTNTIGGFLILYLIVLVPVNYYVLQRKRRLELAWVTTPAVVILFTVGAYAIGYTMMGGELRLTEATLIEGSANARYARMVSDASIFSPARRSYGLTVSNPYAVSQIIATQQGERPPEVYLDETSTIEDVNIPMWSSKSFQAVGGTDLGGALEANLKLSGSVLQGSVKNNTGVNLKNCYAFRGTSCQRLGDLNKGDTCGIRVGRGSTPGPPRGPGDSSGTKVDFRLYQFIRNKAQSSPEPLLVGFADSRAGVIDTPDRRPVADRATCYVFHLGRSAGDWLVITQAMVTARAAGAPRGSSQSHEGQLETGLCYQARFTGVYTLPVPTGFKVTALRVTGSISGPPGASGAATNVRAAMLNLKTGKWDPVTIPCRQSVPNPANYVNASNEVQVRVIGAQTGVNLVRVKFGVAGEAERQ